MPRPLGSGKKPVDPRLIDNKKYKKSPEELKEIASAIPTVQSAKLKPPKELTDGAKKEWLRIVKLYSEFPEPILNDLDVELLKSYCIYVDLRNRLYQECVQTENLFYTSITTSVSTTKMPNATAQRAGQIKKTIINPILREIRQIESRITVLANELGLTPAGRVAMGIRKAKKESDPLNDFYNSLRSKDD